MEYLTSIKSEKIEGKTVLLRIDCDVDLKDEGGRLMVDEDYRLKCVLPTIDFLLNHEVRKIIMIGHVGRPEGKVVEELKLGPIARWFVNHIDNLKCKVQSSKLNSKFTVNLRPNLLCKQNLNNYEISNKIVLLENIRFDEREEENEDGLARELAGLGDIYVNEAFGVSHREHASIVGIPKYLPSYYGLQFQKEIEKLTWLKEKAPRPLVFVLGGSKDDKLEYLDFLSDWADTLLIGGKLPILIQSSKFKVQSQVESAKLNENGFDISRESIELFKKEITKAATVVWAGPMGKYEEVENEIGTYEIAKAVTNCAGVKFAGGGDTHRIITRLNLWDKFDFVSVGGGAMLAFLKDGKLVGQV